MLVPAGGWNFGVLFSMKGLAMAREILASQRDNLLYRSELKLKNPIFELALV